MGTLHPLDGEVLFRAERSDGLLAVDDRLDGCCPITGKLFVSKESEFHPAATEKVPGFKCMRKTKPAPRYPDVARRSIGTRALKTYFAIAGDRKQIVRVLGDNPKNISGIQPAQRKLFRTRLPVARSELLPVCNRRSHTPAPIDCDSN